MAKTKITEKTIEEAVEIQKRIDLLEIEKANVVYPVNRIDGPLGLISKIRREKIKINADGSDDEEGEDEIQYEEESDQEQQERHARIKKSEWYILSEAINSEKNKLKELIGTERTLFDKYVKVSQDFLTVKQQLEEIVKEKQSRAEALLNSRKNVVNNTVKKLDLTLDPRINIDISKSDAEKIEALLSDIQSTIIRIGDVKHPKAWLTMKEMMDHYTVGEETIEKIPRAKLNRILVGKGYKYSRDDMDKYLDGLGGEKQKA